MHTNRITQLTNVNESQYLARLANTQFKKDCRNDTLVSAIDINVLNKIGLQYEDENENDNDN